MLLLSYKGYLLPNNLKLLPSLKILKKLKEKNQSLKEAAFLNNYLISASSI